MKGGLLLKAYNSVVSAFRKLTGIFGLVGALGLFLMVAITFVDVIMRYFIKHPIVGSQELVEFLMVITMYGGMPYAAAKGMLITVDALAKKFHPIVRRVLRFFFTVLCAACSWLMCAKVFEQFLYHLNNPMLKSSILKFSYAPFYCFAAIGLLLLAIEMTLEIGLTGADLVQKRGTPFAEEGQGNG